MRKNNTFLILLLLLALLAACGAGLLLDTAAQQTPVRVGEYHVQITEICAKNETVTADNDGRYRDYIELYNAGDDVELAGCVLTDGSASYRIESLFLPAGSYRAVFLGKETTGFALSASGGDSIQLRDGAGNILAQCKLQTLYADQAMVLENGVWKLTNQPSPGFPNTNDGIHAFTTGKPAEEPDIRLSEILLANRTSMPDEKGVFSDMVELHNESTDTVHLGGWYLTDRMDNRLRYRLPEITLGAGEYLLLYCDGENYISEDGNIHTNFALCPMDILCLTDPAGNYVTAEPVYSADDLSLAWTAEGYTLMASSLGHPNTEEGCFAARDARLNKESCLVISEVVTRDSAVPVNGKLTGAVEILNRSGEKVSTEGWYLSDGGDPYALPLPEMTLAAGGRLLVEVSREESGFALSAEDTVYLLGPDHRFGAVVACEGISAGLSIGLSEDAQEQTYALAEVSAGFPNTAAGVDAFRAAPAGLQLSEAMSANGSYLPGPYGETHDWVELYNGGKTDIDLSAYCLTDSDNLKKFPLGAKTLGAGGYLVLILSESGKNLPAGFEHIPMNLSAEGETLYLTRDGLIEDFLILPALEGDTAYGRCAGEGRTAQLEKPTPGEPNAAEARISRTPAALMAQGSYDGVTSLSIGFAGEGEIFYTTDCSEPDRSSTPYTGPVEITETTVFRVCAYEAGCTRSGILDLTYLLNEGDNLDTVTVVTDPVNLWGNIGGIYAAGPGASGSYPYFGANYWRDMEVPATVTLLTKEGTEEFSEGCGLKIFGGYSRAQKKKSFACMFRSKFGDSTLDYPLFGEAGLDSYQSFVLRAGGQDYYAAKFRDELITSLANEHLGIAVQQYRPVVLYLNGEYWGIYFIREKLTDQYVAGHWNVKPETVTLTVQEGREVPDYMALRSYVRSHDLREKEHYDYLASRIDLDSYIDHVIIQMWIENTDLGNVKFFRIGEGRWTWVLFDTDASMHNPMRNTIGTFLTKNQQHPHDQYARDFVNHLMVNEAFRERFLRRMAYQLSTVWNEAVVTARVDYFHDLLAGDIEKECARWDHKVSSWEENVQLLRDFAATRTGYFLDHVQEYFGLTGAEMRELGFEV